MPTECERSVTSPSTVNNGVVVVAAASDKNTLNEQNLEQHLQQQQQQQQHQQQANSIMDSGDMSTSQTSTTSNGSSGTCNGGRKTSITSPDPTAYVAKARVTRPTPPPPPHNPMQFVQIKPCNLYQTAQEQLKKAEEVKKIKEIRKEEPEDWQNNLDNWKSSRRKRVEHIIDRVVEVKKLELEEHDRTRRKSKTFNEMMEERNDRPNRGLTKLASLAVYAEDEANDLSDLGIGTSSASGKSSLSEDYDNNSVMSDNAAELDKAITNSSNNTNNGNSAHNSHHHTQHRQNSANKPNNHTIDNNSTTREYISSPGYETSSSTAPASSPDPCEYTYEGAIQDYKQRVSRAASGLTSAALQKLQNAGGIQTKETTPERLIKQEAVAGGSNPPRRGSKIEDRLFGFEVQSPSEEYVEGANKVKVDVPKIDISKRKEIFESANSQAAGSQQETGKSQTGNAAPPRVTLRDRFKVQDAAEEQPLRKETKRLSGDISSIKERLQSLEQQKQQTTQNNATVNGANGAFTKSSLLPSPLASSITITATTATMTTANNKKVDIPPVPPLKERLSSLQNAATKEEVRKPPVALVDARQLEIMKNEEEKAKLALEKKQQKQQSKLPVITTQPKETVAVSASLKETATILKITEESNEIDRDDSGIHTAEDIEVDAERLQSSADEQIKLNAAIEALALEEKQFAEAANAVNQIEAEFDELSIGSMGLAPLPSSGLVAAAANPAAASVSASVPAAAATSSTNNNDHMEYSINEALELALEAIDKESNQRSQQVEHYQLTGQPQQMLQQQTEQQEQQKEVQQQEQQQLQAAFLQQPPITAPSNRDQQQQHSEAVKEVVVEEEEGEVEEVLINKTDEQKCEQLQENNNILIRTEEKSEEDIAKEPIYENITSATFSQMTSIPPIQQQQQQQQQATVTPKTISASATTSMSNLNKNHSNSNNINHNNNNKNFNNINNENNQNFPELANQTVNSNQLINQFSQINKQPQQQQQHEDHGNNLQELTNAFANKTTITTTTTTTTNQNSKTQNSIQQNSILNQNPNYSSSSSSNNIITKNSVNSANTTTTPTTTTTSQIMTNEIEQQHNFKQNDANNTQQQQQHAQQQQQQQLNEPYYQVPKSCEPYYDAPKHLRPIPVYENIEIFFNGTQNGELSVSDISKPLEPPKEKPPPPPIDSPPASDDEDDDADDCADDDDHHHNHHEADVDDDDDDVVDGRHHHHHYRASQKNQIIENAYETLSRHQSGKTSESITAASATSAPSPPIKRMNSTKRIKKELRNKRSSFLGIEGTSLDDDETYLELTVAPPPDMAQLLQEERRLEKQLYLKAGLCDSSDTGESRDSGVSENHSRQSSEHYTNSSEENDGGDNGTSPLTLQTNSIPLDLAHHAATTNEMIYQNEGLLKVAHTTPLLQTVKGNSAESWTESATVAAAATQSLTEATATATAKMMCIEEKIREQEEVLRVERELLQLEQEELKRQRESLMLRENMARRELQHGAKMLMSANRRSLQDLNALGVVGNGNQMQIMGNGDIDYQQPQAAQYMAQQPLAAQQQMLNAQQQQQQQLYMQQQQQQQQQPQQIYANIPNLQQQYYQMDTDYRKSMSDLNEFSKRMVQQPPVPPSKPMRAMHVSVVAQQQQQQPQQIINGADYGPRQRHSLNSQQFGGSLVKIAATTASAAQPTAAPRQNQIYSNFQQQQQQQQQQHQHHQHHQSQQNLSSNGGNQALSQTSLYPGNMSRNTLHALSATPKPKYTDGWVQVQQRKNFDSNLTNDPAWVSAYQQKRKSMPDASYAYQNGMNNASTSSHNHWLVQEAEQRRLAEQRRATVSANGTPTHQIKSLTNGGTTTIAAATNGKPLPDSIIQSLTERVQSKGIGERKRNNLDKSPLHAASAYQQHQSHHQYHKLPTQQQQQQQQQHPAALLTTHRHSLSNIGQITNSSAISTPNATATAAISAPSTTTSSSASNQQHDKVLSVSGKKKCSHCGDELGRGAAMIIESLLLFYHINCFKCCVCHVQLGDGLNGTDVRVRNHKLHCQNCYSSDDGIKFSCV